MATENGWSLKTTPYVFETKLLKVSEVKQVTPYYTGANNSSGYAYDSTRTDNFE